MFQFNSCFEVDHLKFAEVFHHYYHLYGSYNDFHNILRLFDILPNFPFTISETKLDY